MEDDDLIRAIAAVKAGDLQGAQAILSRVVQTNPRSEQGWLWLGNCLSDPQKRLFCYQKVLVINPQNEAARQALQALSSNTPPAEREIQPNRAPVQVESADQSTAVPKDKFNFSEGLGYRLSILVPVLFVFLCVLPLIYLLMTGQMRSLAARFLPLPSPSATHAPAVTSTPSLSPSPSHIPDTSTPSPSPSLSPSTTSTPYRFKPGDPTAIPLGRDITDPNFIAGVAAFDAENYQEVIRLMDAIIESNPDLAPPYRYRGMAYWYLDDCVSGLADQEKALSLNPEYAAAWADRGLMNKCLGDEAQELEDFQKALSLDPSLAFVHHNLGVDYYNWGDYETSLKEYNLSVAIDPTRAGAWGEMSAALRQLGRYDECIEAATKAIEIKPDLWLAYINRGHCNINIGNNEQGNADYQVVLDHDPTDSNSWFDLGYAQQQSGEPQAAIASYSKSLELDPSNYSANINRGNIYLDLRQYNNAFNDFNAALKFGDIALAYSGRGSAYYYLKKYDLAIKDLEKSRSLYPYDANTFCFLSLTYFEVKRYQDALDSAASSHEIAPKCGGQRLVEIQARSYYGLGNYEQALLYIDKALDMGEYTLGYYYRGIIFQAAGRNDEAIRDLEQFLSYYEPNDNHIPEIADARSRLTKLKP
jgi:tetratricopeptide (TPR) repeat protein